MKEGYYDLSPSSGEAHFSHYGKHFQEKIFQGLLTDHRWSSQMIEVMHPDYFEMKYLAYLTEKYFSYFTKYRSFPTPQLLISIAFCALSLAYSSHETCLRPCVNLHLHILS